jgi:hypothetical protein
MSSVRKSTTGWGDRAMRVGVIAAAHCPLPPGPRLTAYALDEKGEEAGARHSGPAGGSGPLACARPLTLSK